MRNNLIIILILYFFGQGLKTYSQENNNENTFIINIGSYHYDTVNNLNQILNDEETFGLSNYHHFSRFSSLDVDWDDDGLDDLFVNFSSKPEIGSFSGLLTQSLVNDSIKFDYNPDFKVFFQGDAGNIARSVGDFNYDGMIDVYYHTENYHGEDGLQPPSYVFEEDEYSSCRYNTYDKFYINNGNGFDLIEGFDSDNSCPQNHAGNIIIKDSQRDKIIGFSPNCGNSFWTKYSVNENNVVQKEPYLSNPFCNSDGYYHSPQAAQGINFKDGKVYIPIVLEKYKHIETGQIGFRGDQYWNDNSLDYNQPHSELVQFEGWRVLVYNENNDTLINEINFEDNWALEIQQGRNRFGHDWFFHVVDFDNDGDVEFFINSYLELYDLNQNSYVSHGQGIKVFDHEGTQITQSVIGWSNFQEYFNMSEYSSELNSNRDLSISFDKDPTNGNYTGIHLFDINQDGLIDLIPQTGWKINLQNTPGGNSEWKYMVFMNNGIKFFPTVVNFNDDNRTNLSFINGNMKGFKLPVDLNNDGFHEMMHIRMGNSNNPGNIDVFEFSFDNDNDGVINQEDANPNDPYSTSNDIDGNRIFNLPNNNYTIFLESLSCIGENDGSISISVEDEDLNYILRVNGDNPVDLNSSEGYQQTLSNLSPGIYQLCFTVEGESGYNQCFDINITEPAPLSASSKVDKEKKSISFSLDGSDRYSIIHNGVEKIFDISNPEIPLKKGVNFIEVKTDKLCQGTYTEEVFISEKVEFYPNPTTDLVNLYIHGKDKTVDLKIVDRDGNIIGTSCRDIQSNRKVQVNLEQYPKGVYLIQTKGETVQKTIKIIRE